MQWAGPSQPSGGGRGEAFLKYLSFLKYTFIFFLAQNDVSDGLQTECGLNSILFHLDPGGVLTPTPSTSTPDVLAKRIGKKLQSGAQQHTP